MSEIGRSTWRAMNPSVSLTSDLRSRRSAAPTSAGVSTIRGSIAAKDTGRGAEARSEPGLDLSQVQARRRPGPKPPPRPQPRRPGASTIRFGIVPQPAGSIRAEASRSSQSPSARMAAGATISDAGGAEEREAARLVQSARGAIPGASRPPPAKQKDLGVAGATRGKRRALNEAEPQDDWIAIPPARDTRGGQRGRGSGKKNENRRFGHGWFRNPRGATPGTPPRRRLLIDDFARRS